MYRHSLFLRPKGPAKMLVGEPSQARQTSFSRSLQTILRINLDGITEHYILTIERLHFYHINAKKPRWAGLFRQTEVPDIRGCPELFVRGCAVLMTLKND